MIKYPIPSNFFTRLFRKSLLIELDHLGITVIKEGKEAHFLWKQMDAPPKITIRLSGAQLSFAVNGKKLNYSMLCYRQSFKCKSFLFSLWAEKNREHLQRFLTDVEEQCVSRFIKESTIQQIQKRAKTEVDRWCVSRSNKGLSEQSIRAINQLKKIHGWNKASITVIRQDYIQKQRYLYKAYFDSVESNPLTEKQRIACITDNDNNLLLAGAGTGKTSVMIGRTGYLLKSQQACPDDMLLLAYGRIAAKEMDERIKDKLGLDNIKTSTFHSLGMSIISAVEGRSPNLSPFENDTKAKFTWVNDTLEALMLDNSYKEELLEYFSSYYFVDKSPFEFKTEGEHLQYLSDNEICSLNGDAVKSYGELVIANWLFRNGINYQYEPSYRFDVSTDKYRQYHPDFYLPDYDIYIEYYGTDKNGNTAPWIDKERYQASIRWKRQTHEKYGTGYVEVFYHQHKVGKLLPCLKALLLEKGVQFAPVLQQALLETLKEQGKITVLAKLFSLLIDMYKGACLDKISTETIIQKSVNPRQTQKALELLIPLYERYEHYLKQREFIDFNDMIGKALMYVQSGQFVSSWKYILVDEFQDISEPRARLVKALRDSKAGTSLFCVGDDWQAIYRFSGSDVKLTTHFSQYFGATSKTTLDLTFRFNSAIGDVATRFITQNPVQIKKEIRSLIQEEKPAVSILRQGQNEQSITPLEKALSAITERVLNSKNPTKQNKVYLLARFWHQMPTIFQLQHFQKQYPFLNIERQSFHASKGKEADYVVIMGLVSGKHGFPSQKVIPPLVDALLAQDDKFEFAEERRLFYVALTRAKHRAYLLADMTEASDFVIELIKANYPIDTKEFETSFVQKLFEQLSCRRCKTGILKPRESQHGKFLSCSLYPRCKHKETLCTQCGSPMSSSKIPGFQVCINETCGDIRPLCKRCGGEMRLRNGKYGAFWSCASYRKEASNNCGYTLSIEALSKEVSEVE